MSLFTGLGKGHGRSYHVYATPRFSDALLGPSRFSNTNRN